MARQIYITDVAVGSPSDGMLKKGDVLAGAAGVPFYHDPRKQLGQNLTAAEAGDGKLGLICWRDGKIGKIAVQVPVLGAYTPPPPYDCQKSKKILNEAGEKLAERMKMNVYDKQNPIPRALNALGP